MYPLLQSDQALLNLQFTHIWGPISFPASQNSSPLSQKETMRLVYPWQSCDAECGNLPVFFAVPLLPGIPFVKRGSPIKTAATTLTNQIYREEFMLYIDLPWLPTSGSTGGAGGAQYTFVF